MADIVSSLVSGGISGLADAVTKVIGAFKLPPEKQTEAEIQIRLLASQAEERLIKDLDSERANLTARLKADIASDSWLPKNIRPLVLLFLTVVFALISIGDGASILSIKDTFIDAYQLLLLTAFGFYFGSRGLEKIARIRGNKPNP